MSVIDLSPGVVSALSINGNSLVQNQEPQKWAIALLSVSEFPVQDISFSAEPFRKQIEGLSGLTDGWDGFGAPAPSFYAINSAKNALAFVDFVPAPAMLVPSAEGGVAISFMLEDRVGQVEFTNDGEIVGLTYSDKHEPNAWNVSREDTRAAFTRIRNFIGG